MSDALPGALLVVVAVVTLAAAAYWALVITEGAYLGPRLVTWLYDRSAHDYDGLKDFPAADDAARITAPLLAALGSTPAPRVLDVATGTGRVPLELLSDPGFDGEVVAVDLSAGMLALAWRKVGGWWPRAQLGLADAAALPFESEAFDGVTCLEALEFTPRPTQTLLELARVLRPGGVLLVTNRVNWEARLMPGRAFARPDFEARLESAGMREVHTERWQTYYDLVWSRKAGAPATIGDDRRWPSGVRCPACGGPIGGPPRAPGCTACGRGLEWRRGAWDLRAAR